MDAATPGALGVFEISRRIKELLETGLGRVQVEGEVVGCKRYPSGHTYFSLSGPDPAGGTVKIDCVVFRSARASTLELRDGLKVVATGRVTAYAPTSRYQLVVDRVQEAGLGDLLRRLEALKERLRAEGLFDEARKRPLPFLPRRVGVVTSLRGAAVRDVVRTVLARWPARLLLVDTLVQGEGAAEGIAAGIALLGRVPDVDVIVIGRGGGSMEDLWAFNEEALVRAVAASRVPIVSAVGHETDFVLTDFAADLRAATPTAAAQRVVPSHAEASAATAALGRRLAGALARRVDDAAQRLDDGAARLRGAAGRLLSGPRQRLALLGARLDAQRPDRRLALERARLDRVAERLGGAGARLLDRPRTRVDALRLRLAPLSPFAPLERGYALARTPDGRVVARADQVAPGDVVDLLLGQGGATARVEATRPDR